jgi:hypothetical protein
VDPGISKFSNTDIATPQNGATSKFEANIVPQLSKSISAVLSGASAKAAKELETIKDIRNEFGHRTARSFSFGSSRDLANNLFFK